jgi:hypothetical protein
MKEERSGFFETLLEQTPTKEDVDEEENKRFYASLRGARDRANNIEFRKAEGAWPFREYSYLVGGESVHAGEFVLRFATGERVTVRGRHLRALYDKILRHRVIWLREGAADENAPEGETFVDEIEGPVKEEPGELP